MVILPVIAKPNLQSIQAGLDTDLEQECAQNNGWPLGWIMALNHLCVLAAEGTYFDHFKHKNAEVYKRQKSVPPVKARVTPTLGGEESLNPNQGFSGNPRGCGGLVENSSSALAGGI